jgi:putative aminopeptidase FrvX
MNHSILQELCSLPTAPFAEQHVIRWVEAFAKKRKLRLSRDRSGNILLELPGRARSAAARWVYAAHTDHPGFVAERMIDSRTLRAHFRGGVLADYLKGTRVRFYPADTTGPGIPARVLDVEVDKADPPYPRAATLRVSADVPEGTPGVFDVGEAKIRGRRFQSRVCDDLAGAAAALTMLDQLLRKPPSVPVAVLLTRGEEAGFIGAIAASIKPQLLRKTDRIIAIETSAMQPYAPQGKGAIIRVGDRSSVFNSSLSYFLTYQAEQLAKKDKSFIYQRALMPGGTCEATVYDIYGFTASSICVALGNYHNMDKSKKKIAAEYIDLNDWESMVKLFIQIARTGGEYQPGHRILRKRIEKRFEQYKSLLV